LEDLPDFVAIHGECYARKTVEIGEHWGFTPFIDEATYYAVAETELVTSNLFYLDMVTQLANTLLSATYQLNVRNDLLEGILGSAPSWTFKAGMD
jgi:hypothetical protein